MYLILINSYCISLSFIERKILFRQVIHGGRLELHPRIPESIQVLIQITMVDADHRPTFTNLKESLKDLHFDNG